MDNTSKLLELAKEKFGALTEAEQKFFKAVANGEVANYSKGVEEDNLPANIADWGTEHVLKADCIAWLCTDKQASELVTHRGIHLKGVHINKGIDLSFARISFPLCFEKSGIPKGMNLQNSEIFSLSLDGSHIGPINANGIKVEQDVFMRYGFKANGIVILRGSIIRGNLEFDNAKLMNMGDYALLADQASVDGNILFRNGFRAIGEVDLLGATVGGSLDCGNAEFINEHGRSLSADGLTVERVVRFDDGFTSKGEVRLIGAKISGFLTCINGKFINPDGKALVVDMAEVKGSVMLRHGFIAEGEVSLLDAKIGTSLECNGGQFINAKGRALNADKVNIKGHVFLNNGFKAEGLISLVSAVIDGGLVCVDTAKSEEMNLDLRSTKIGTLWDEKGSWPENGKLFLQGFVYNNIDDKAPRDAKSRIDWLQRQASFRPQPYEQLAAVLRQSGDDAAAKNILIAKNKDKARLTKLTWSEFCWYRVFGRIIGYGYRPWQAAWIGLVIILLGWFFYGVGLRTEVMTPTKETAYISKSTGEDRRVSQDYPKFNALVYSFDVFVPLVDLRQANYWLPNANRKGELSISEHRYIPIDGKALRYYFWFEIIAGWVLTTLLVVGVTGLVRK